MTLSGLEKKHKKKKKRPVGLEVCLASYTNHEVDSCVSQGVPRLHQSAGLMTIQRHRVSLARHRSAFRCRSSKLGLSCAQSSTFQEARCWKHLVHFQPVEVINDLFHADTQFRSEETGKVRRHQLREKSLRICDIPLKASGNAIRADCALHRLQRGDPEICFVTVQVRGSHALLPSKRSAIIHAQTEWG